MIRTFSVLYVGHIALDNVGLQGTPADERRYPNERLVEGMAMAEAVAQEMDELGYDTLWMAEHHFQREGYEVIPNLILLGTHLAGVDRAGEVRLRVQRHPGLASATPGRGLRDGRLPDPRPGGTGHRPRVPDAGSRDSRGTAARCRGQRGAVPRADRADAQGVPSGRVLAPGPLLHRAGPGAVPRVPTARGDARSAARCTSRSSCGKRSPPASRSRSWSAMASRAW